MSKFIKVTEYEGDNLPTFINVDHIIDVCSKQMALFSSGKATVINLTDDWECVVTESVEQVMRQIEGTK